MSSPEPTPDQRRPGRPRKWANEAERVRAYRQRKAQEQASADELRAERRVLKRQLSDANRGRARTEAALVQATRRVDGLEDELARVRGRLHDAEVRVEQLRMKNDELLNRLRAEAKPVAAAPGLSRQQRRAAERTKPKRRR